MMQNVVSNIQTSERLARLIFGGVLIAGLLTGFTKTVACLLGAGLIAEGLLGWCGVPILVKRFKLENLFGSQCLVDKEP